MTSKHRLEDRRRRRKSRIELFDVEAPPSGQEEEEQEQDRAG